MTTASETECNFDGRCRLSKSADVVLEFDDGSTLKAHSFILRAASPVIETALKDCENASKIRLRSVSREVWIDILREFYPVKSVVLTNMVSEEGCDAAVRVGLECRKYGIQSVLDSMDEIIVRLTKTIPQDSRRRWDDRMSTYAKVATSLGLQGSIKQVGDYVLCAMEEIERCYTNSGGYRSNERIQRHYPPKMAEVIKDLLDMDDADWMKDFTLKMLRNVLKTNV